MARLLELLWLYSNLGASVLILSVLFYGLEAVFPAEKQQTQPRRWFNTAYYFFLLAWILLIQEVALPFFSYASLLSGGGFLPRFFKQPTGVLGQIILALVFGFVWDFWQYWVHRLQHSWPFLWETHRFHHTETALNSSAQARHHFLNHVLFITLYLPMSVLWGGLAPHFVAMFLMFRLWGFVNHANLQLNLGPFTPVISGPQWHRIHHSVLTEHQDKNFAAFFPVIDIIFGTYYLPAKDDYPATGLPQHDYSTNLREATLVPFVGMYKMVRNLIWQRSELRVGSLNRRW